MDLENAWTNCRDETPPIVWKNKAQYSPLCYSNSKSLESPYSNSENEDSIYISGNDISPYSNFRYCTSPECPNTIPYAPEMCVPNELNGSIRYPAYHPRMTPIRYRESLGHNNYHLLYNDPRLKAEIDANNYYSQLSQHQHMKMYSQACMRNYDSNMNQMKQNMKKKRKQPKNKNTNTLNTTSTTNKTPNLMKSVNDTDNSLLRHENNSNYSNFRLNSSPTVSKVATETDAFSNEKSFVNEQSYLPEMKDEICESQRDFNGRFNLPYVTNDVSLDSENTANIPNQQHNILSATNDETKANTSTAFDMNFSKDNTNEEATNNSTAIQNSNLSDAPVEEIPPEELTHQFFNIQDLTVENLNIKSENIIFQPIFEGKDENGEDVIVLLASPVTQQELTQENIFDTIVNAENGALVNNHEMATNLIKIVALNDQNSLQIDCNAAPYIANEVKSENLDENHSQLNANTASQNNYNMPCDQNESVIISNVNDFFLEELVETSENNCSNSKRMKKHEIELDKNTAVKRNRYKKKKSADVCSLDDINTYKSTECQVTFTNREILRDNINISGSLPKKAKKYKAKKLKWKRHFQWKSNTQLTGIKNMCFSKLMKRLRHQYKEIKNDAEWEIMKIILDKIGGTVLQSIYSTLQLLAKIHTRKISKKFVSSILKKK